MTLSTRADHELSREADHAYDEAEANSWAVAERHVLDSEADSTEADPATVDVEALGDRAAREAREEMEDAARLYGSRTAAEVAGERAFETAFDAVAEMVAQSPLLEAER